MLTNNLNLKIYASFVTLIADLKTISALCSSYLSAMDAKVVYSVYIAEELITQTYAAYKEIDEYFDDKCEANETKQRLFETVIAMVEQHAVAVIKKIKPELQKQYFKALALYLKGGSIKTLSEHTLLSHAALEDFINLYRWPVIKKQIKEKVSGVVKEFIHEVEPIGNFTVQDRIQPIINSLSKQTKEYIDNKEISPKDCLKAFIELSKLKAQLSGEMVERKEVNVTQNEANKRIMLMSEDDFKAIDITTIEAGVDLLG